MLLFSYFLVNKIKQNSLYERRRYKTELTGEKISKRGKSQNYLSKNDDCTNPASNAVQL